MPESLRQSPDNLKPVPFPEMDCEKASEQDINKNSKEGMKLLLSCPSLTGRQLLVNIYAAKVKQANIGSTFPFPINLRTMVFDG